MLSDNAGYDLRQSRVYGLTLLVGATMASKKAFGIQDVIPYSLGVHLALV